MNNDQTQTIIWIDTETTGLDYKRHCLHQIVAIAQKGDAHLDTLEIEFAPHPDRIIDPQALHLDSEHPLTTEALREREMSYVEGIQKFIQFINQFVPHDPGNPYRVLVGGYNIRFDIEFILEAMTEQGDPYLFGRINSALIDVMSLVGVARANGIIPHQYKSNKLADVCRHLAIPFSNAHEAGADIRATIKLYYHLRFFLDLNATKLSATNQTHKVVAKSGDGITRILIDKRLSDNPNVNKITRTVKERTGSIGGSDIAGILGQSKYKTPLTVFHSMQGRMNTEIDSIPAWVGRMLEAHIIDDIATFNDITGIAIEGAIQCIEGEAYTNATCPPELVAHPDGYCIYEGALCLLEIKTGSYHVAKGWKNDELPIEYYLQVQTYLRILELERAVVFGLIDNQPHVRIIDADREIQNEITKVTRSFIDDFIKTDTMPLAIGTDTENELLKNELGTGEYYIDEPHAVKLFDQWQSAKEIKNKHAKIEKETATLVIQTLIAIAQDKYNAQFAGRLPVEMPETTSGGTRKVVVQEIHRKSYQVKASSYKQLRVPKEK